MSHKARALVPIWIVSMALIGLDPPRYVVLMLGLALGANFMWQIFEELEEAGRL